MVNINRVYLHKLLNFTKRYSLALANYRAGAALQSVVVTATSVFAIFVGGLVLLSCYLQQETLSIGFLSIQPVMKISTALCFILAGLSLWLLNPGDTAKPHQQSQASKTRPRIKLRRYCAHTFALIVNVLGILALIEIVIGRVSGIHRFYSPQVWNPLIELTSMGWSASLSFMLVGRALMFLTFPKTKRSYWYAQVLALIAGAIALQALVGYAYVVQVSTEIGFFGFFAQTMSMLTALGFAALCVGILWLSCEQGLMRLVTSRSYSGWLARRLLLTAIIVPLFLGWLILQGQRAGVYDPGYALALFAILLIVTFTVLIWQSTASLEYLHRQCDRIDGALKANEAKLRSFFEANVIGIIVTDANGNIRKVNDEWLKVLGYSRHDVLAQRISWQQITPPEYTEVDRRHIDEAKALGVCKPYEKEYFCQDGSRVPVLVGYTFISENSDELVAFVLDLSQQKAARREHKQVEQRFWLAAEHIPDAFVIYDAQRRWQFANVEALRVTGKTHAELIGHTDEELFPPQMTATYLHALICAQQTGNLQTTEATIVSSSGAEYTSHVKFVPVLDETGQLSQILAFHHDITTSKRAQIALHSQHQWQEQLLNLMPTPLVLVEPGSAKVTFANRAADGLAGGEFPQGRPAAEYHTIYYCTDAEGNRIPDQKMPGVRLARGERLDGDQMDWHTSAGIRSLLIYGDTLPAMHGHDATGVMLIQDISKLKQAEKGLSLGYKRLQLLFSTANDLLSNQHPVALLDNVFRKLSEQIGLDLYVNYLIDEPARKLTLASYSGIDPELIERVENLELGQGVCGVVAEQRTQMALEDVMQSSEAQTEGIRRFGVNAFASYPLLVQGRLMGTLGFGSRSRNRFSQNELGMMQAVCDQIAIALERTRLVESLQMQTEQLQIANRMKDEFLAVISHELRSPLNAILGWSQLLRSRPQIDSEKQTQALEIIERNAHIQKQLIEDLLDISRIIRGKLRLKTDICNLIPIVESAIDTVRLAADAKEIDLKLRIDRSTNPEAFVIVGDSDRLQQATWNLLTNAIKFTPIGGCVEIELGVIEQNECDHLPRSVQIQVSDTGIGISPEFIPYVFDRFRQADSSSTRHHGGLGLGLAIVRHLIELHGGTVKVDSAGEGTGTCFTVNLPFLAHRNDQKSQSANLAVCEPISSPPPSLSVPNLQGIHVLIVEDETDTREFVAAILQHHQAKVKTASSVAEALTLISQSIPDVMISDIGMPGEDGYSLIRKIRNLPISQGGQIPAAALTAYSQFEDRMRILQAGYQLHVSKPVEVTELTTVVASLASRKFDAEQRS